ncbi:type I secretion C-terminal target domain-containing protein, partial [Halomonas litopenaei]|nr:type I secretion C-terminal target domain-containing protein [Halomonas litopenaei]
GDTSSATLTITVDATPEVEVNPESPNASGNNEVDEAGLDDGGSQAATDLETTSGAINIDTGSDTLASLKIVDKDGTQVDVTNGGTVQGVYGTLTVTESNGDYSYSYTLADNTEDHTTQGSATDDVKDDFALVIEDSDGDVNDSATLTIDIKDDVPEAKDDAAETDENEAITVNVLDGTAGGLDVAGADGPYTFVTDSVSLASGSGTITNVDANGNITFTPADGFEGDAVINYTIRDADGDTSSASLTITVDATPEVEVNPESPNASGNNEVDEAGLDDGGSQAATDLETTSGAINIDTGSDTLASLKIVDKDGTQVDVTNGGTVQGVYGTLTVTESNGDYSYSYTLADNTEDHTTQGTATDDVKDDFALVIEDSDGDVNNSATLTIDIKDDVPQVFSEAEHALESGNGSLDFGPNVGADGVGEVVFAAALDGQPATDSQGNALRVDGAPLNYRLSADGTTLYAESADGAEDGFSVTLDTAGDGYSVEVIGEVANGVDASAELADGELVTGGYLALNHTDGATDNDLLVSSDSGPVVVSGGQIAVSTGTSVRIDALKDLSTGATGATWSDHQGLASFTQRVQVSGSEGATTALVIAALMYAADGAAGSGDPATGSSDYLTLTTDDITVFNAIGVDVTSQVTLTLDGDGVRVEGLKDGWQVKLETGDTRPFEAVEIEAADSATSVNDNLLLDDMEYRLGGPKEDFELELGLLGRDGDGDELASTLTLKGDAPDQLLVGGNGEQSLEGGGGDDVIIGDAGGVLNEPADNYNVTLIIDSSGSMGNSSGNGGLSRLELAKQALEHLVEQLSEHEGTINLQIIDFDTAVTAGDSIVFNDFSAADLTAAIAFIEAMVAQGGTNYEDGFDTAREWLASQTNGYANIGFFLTDGVPTYYQNSNGDRDGNGSSFTQTVMNESVNAFGELASIAQVAAIGMGNGINTNVLRFFDNTNTLGTASTNLSGNANDAIDADVGQPQIVNSGGDLDAALQEAAASLIPTGADSLSGGGGDDILVADTLNSDDLAWTNADSGEDFNAGEHDGLGYGGLYAYLTWTKVDPNGSGVADRIDDPDGTAPTDEEIREYIRAEIDNLTDDRADGSANTLDGGEGDDLLIGGAGADNLLGGVGDDTLIGGAGADTLVGGAGNDIIDLGTGADVVAWNDGDAGTSATPASDEINDFTLGDVGSDAESDRLEMSDLLDGATEASVNDYLYAEEDGSGNTVLYVKSDGGIGNTGGDADQVITLNGVDMGGQDSATFLQQMIDDGQLQVE